MRGRIGARKNAHFKFPPYWQLSSFKRVCVEGRMGYQIASWLALDRESFVQTHRKRFEGSAFYGLTPFLTDFCPRKISRRSDLSDESIFPLSGNAIMLSAPHNYSWISCTYRSTDEEMKRANKSVSNRIRTPFSGHSWGKIFSDLNHWSINR